MTTTNQAGVISKATQNKQVAKKQPTMKDYIKLYEGEIAKALPSVMTPERFTRIATTALTNTPQLANCTPQSFIGAMMNAAQLGLEPNTVLGQAYLIPYKNQVQFQVGYKGLLDLAYRSGEVKTIDAQTVYENDEFVYELGLEPKLKHVPAIKDRGNPVYFYAVIKLKNGGYSFQVMSIEDVRTHAKKYSKSFNNGPWQSNFEEMAKKTVLKKALKYAPLKSDFARQVTADESIKTKVGEDMSEIKNEFMDVEYEEHNEDPITGEIKE